jgi:hypothetical protein
MRRRAGFGWHSRRALCVRPDACREVVSAVTVIKGGVSAPGALVCTVSIVCSNLPSVIQRIALVSNIEHRL